MFARTVGQDPARTRIIAAGADILARGGRDALTTRAVAAAAGVQAPIIYRLFGDKDGLVDAVAEYGYAAYVAAKKAQTPLPDPLDDFRLGWDLNVAFGLAHPAIFSIINGDPRPERRSPAAAAGLEILGRRIGRLAAAGLLRVSQARAVDLVHSSGVGVVLTLLGMAEDQRDPDLSTAAREAIITAITNDQPAIARPGPASAAIALRASLDSVVALTPGERHLLVELLDRLAATANQEFG